MRAVAGPCPHRLSPWLLATAIVASALAYALASAPAARGASSLACAVLRTPTLVGSDSRGDSLTGSDATADFITGLGLGDYLNGKAKNDCLQGGAGNDSLWGDLDDDWISGGADLDVLNGGAGDDKLFGDAGRDTYDAGAGDDYVSDVDGVSDTVMCGAGTDTAILDATDTATDCEVVDRPGLTPAPGGVGLRTGTAVVAASGLTLYPGLVPGSAFAAVDPLDGSLVVHEVDGALGQDGTGATAWPLDRWYDSAIATRGRDVGAGWTTGAGYDVRLELESDASVAFVAPSQARYVFVPQADGTYAPADQSADVDGLLSRTADGGYDLVLTDLDATLHFDAYGLLVSARDADTGATVTSTYARSSTRIRLAKATDQANRATTFAVDGSGLLSTVTDPAGRVGTYHYTSGRLADATPPGGIKSTYAYDGSGRLSGIDSSARHVVVAYDASGRVSRLQDGGSSVTVTYPAVDTARCGASATRETDVLVQPLNATVKYCFDAGGALVARIIVDTTAPSTPQPGFAALYDPATNRTLITWSEATDPDLFDGSPGSGVSHWTVSVSRDGGAPVSQTVESPALLLLGGRSGEHLDVTVTYSDNAGNVAVPLTGSVTSGTFVAGESTDLACQPTDAGYTGACVSDEDYTSPDADDEAGVRLVQGGSSGGSSLAAPDPAVDCFPDACVVHVSNSGWAIVRNRPQQYAIGNVHDGARMLVKHTIQTDDSRGTPAWYFGGQISGTYNNCGWIKTSAVGRGLATGFDPTCRPPVFGDFGAGGGKGGPSIATFAAGVNCQKAKGNADCADGYAVTVKRTTTRFRNVLPNPLARLSAGAARTGVDAAGPVGKGKTVNWRYTTIDDRQWVMVRYGKRTNGRTNWFFVKRGDLNPICRRTAGCRPVPD